MSDLHKPNTNPTGNIDEQAATAATAAVNGADSQITYSDSEFGGMTVKDSAQCLPMVKCHVSRGHGG